MTGVTINAAPTQAELDAEKSDEELELDALNAERQEMATELGCALTQVPETREEFMRRRTLEVAAIKARRARLADRATETRVAHRGAELELKARTEASNAEAEDMERRRQLQLGASRPSKHAPPNKANTPENYDAMNKADLAALAEARGIVVVRTDGKSGTLRKGDYVTALSG